MPEDKDILFGKLAVERDCLTQEEVDGAREAQERGAEAMGVRMPLAQILVTKGLLTKDQTQEVLNAVAVQTGEARLVGGYEVVAPLGQGAMGAVYKAKKLDADEFVALKILPPSMATERLVARFKREAEITSGLESEHIVRCVEFGYDDKRKCHFCALEYIEGEDLGKRLKRDGTIPEAEAVSIGRAITEALGYAHLNGLVHRDVKPANIMVTPEGTAKLLDLGLARPTGGDAARLTQDGLFVGSAYYASPEQGRGEADLDIRSDVYSLGCTLYHMVTGDPPFKGLPAAEVVQKHASDTVPWPAKANPDVSEGLSRIIAKAMAKDPDERYETPGDFGAELELLADGCKPDELAAPPKRSTVASTGRARAKPRAAPGARRSTPKRSGADAPRRTRDHARGAPRPDGSKLTYAIAGGGAGLVALLALFFLGGSGGGSSERGRSPATEPSTVDRFERAVPPPPRPPPVQSEEKDETPEAPVAVDDPPEPEELSVFEALPTAPIQADLSVPTAPTPPTLAAGLVGHWTFDEGEGAAVRDSSGKGRDGAIEGAAWAQGKLGGALGFDGSGDQIKFGAPDVDPPWSLGLWVKRDPGPRRVTTLMNSDAFSLRLKQIGTTDKLGFTRYRVKDYVFDAAAPVGVWCHITFVGTADGTSVYVDGVKRASHPASISLPMQGFGRGADHSPKALIDDIRAYDRALSGREVKALFEGHGRPAEVQVPKEPERSTRLLVELDAFLMKGDHAAALAWAIDAAASDDYAEVAGEIASAGAVCRSLEARVKAAMEGARALVGEDVKLAGNFGRARKGQVKAAGEKGIELATKFVIAAGGKRHERVKRVTVAWRELTPDQIDELAREGGWRLEGADALVARAYLALGRKKTDAARKALVRAGDHPLAAHLLRKIADGSEAGEAGRPAKPDTPPPTLTLDLGRGVRMEMVHVKPGRFVMGGTEDANPKSAYQGIEKPKHGVEITRGFYIGKYEVTQLQYEALMGANPSKRKAPDLPVEQVTWHQAVQFCLLASARTKKRVRLPTEAEWEYACRAGSSERYSFGGDEARLGEFAWHKGNSGRRTHPVGQKAPNAWGLYDMHGNVWEWVADWYAADYYAKSPGKDPGGADSGERRLLRGGSWFFDVGYKCRSAFRHHNIPARPYHTLGFRAVVSLSPVPEAEGKKGTMPPAVAKLVAEFVNAGATEIAYWNSLKTEVVDVLANKQTGVDTGIECTPAAKYVIVPHPTDQWSPRGRAFTNYRGFPLNEFEGPNPLASLCYTVGPEGFEDRTAVESAPVVGGKRGRMKLVLNDLIGEAYSDNHGRIRVKVMTVAVDGDDKAGEPAGTAPAIAGRWYYKEYGISYSREFTAEGKCIFRKADASVWSLPYRMVEAGAIIIMPDGLVLRHELTAEGRLDIEGKFLASRKDQPG